MAEAYKLTTAETIAKLALNFECWCGTDPCDDCDTRARELVTKLTPHLVVAERRRIVRALADLDAVLATYGEPDRSHWDGCWRIHAACLAARIRRTLTGEDT